MIFRGEIWDAEIPGVGRKPVVIATRDTAIPLLTNLVCVLVTSKYRGHVAEVEVGREEGLSHTSAINCDNIFTLPKTMLTTRRGSLGPVALEAFNSALEIALGLGN